MVKKQIISTIEKQHLIKNKAHIVIGLSGGPDSVCLFHVLCQEAEKREWKLYPVHVNHQFRPGAAEADQAYVEALSAAKGWPCRSFVCDCTKMAKAQKITAEEAGRNARYDAFFQTADALAAEGVPKADIVIAVAQNADDQAETILFRILRGAGTDGLSGISYRRMDQRGYEVVRPLLDCEKKDILTYCAQEDLQPCMDHTNNEAVYTRNKLRLELLPYLEAEYNPSVKDALIRLGKACNSDRDYLWTCAKEAYAQAVKAENEQEILLDGAVLRDLHRSIRQRVLSMAFHGLGLEEDLSYVHFAQCEEIVFHDHPSARAVLPRGYVLTKHYADLRAVRGQAPEQAAPVAAEPLRIRRMTIEDYQQLQLEPQSHAVFDADLMAEAYQAQYGADFQQAIRLATREAGDMLTIGEGKRKKLQDYFVDQKIPKDKRDQIPVVKIGHDVLWILPSVGRGRFCAGFKLCSDTKNVICIEKNCVLC